MQAAAQLNMGTKEVHMASSVIKPHFDLQSATSTSASNHADAFTMAGISPFGNIDLRHSIFSAHVANRTAFNGDT